MRRGQRLARLRCDLTDERVQLVVARFRIALLNAVCAPCSVATMM